MTHIQYDDNTCILSISKSFQIYITEYGGAYMVVTGIKETVSPQVTFCDTVHVPSGTDDMQLI